MTREEARRNSMRGVYFLALSAGTAVTTLITGFGWLGVVALIFGALGVLLLYRVGRTL